jgi:hypothetical protein
LHLFANGTITIPHYSGNRNEKDNHMFPTPTSAAERRAILANAHAKYFASRRTGNDSLDVAHALTRANVISSTDRIVDIVFDGTTLVVTIDPELDVLEIDAYGNVLRGAV